MNYLQKELVFKEVGVCLQQLHPRNSWLWVMLRAVPALCTPGIIPLGREHSLAPTIPST